MLLESIVLICSEDIEEKAWKNCRSTATGIVSACYSGPRGGGNVVEMATRPLQWWLLHSGDW